jgi:hypothetical protein
MKGIKLLLLIFGFLIHQNGYSQNDTIIKNGYISMATLMVNYSTYAFDGGDVSYYLCPSCTMDSIPFVIDYVAPGDFGGVTFTLSPSQDSVFNATIIWMGTGQIYYPTSFSTLAPFANNDVLTNKPSDLRYIDTNGSEINETSLINKADSAWNAIDSLEITGLFAHKGFKSAIYLYPPRVGMFDPNAAKWIIFLYHNATNTAFHNMNNRPQLLLFPNPTNDRVEINLENPNSNKIAYRILDSAGKLVDRGSFYGEVYQLDISNVNPGIYLLHLSDENKNMIAAKKILIE